MVTATELPFPLFRRGKVRDVYDLSLAGAPGRLLMVATDRISAFDVVLEPGIPDKGAILTQLSNFWFKLLSGVVPNHLVATKVADFPAALLPYREILGGRAVVAEKLEPIPIECVVRGYLAGSGWAEYQADGKVCGIDLPAGLRQAERLASPIFTPARKAESGHDENITFAACVATVGQATADALRDASLRLYDRARSLAQERGILIADTKFEFGRRADGTLVLMDEVLTPDSSRFWPAASWKPGTNPPSFDKQYLRDWLSRQAWDKTPPGPRLPADVVRETALRYQEAFRLITGSPFPG
ncbi:MAG: phosphoribosylaminoimidazolesuccinocarboxamide synthase [Thermoplasmatota archaeon]